MRVEELSISEVKIINTVKFSDSRGFFSEIYNKSEFLKAGITIDFVQDNHSYSCAEGVVRGLHFQLPPYAQDKLLRVIKGSLLDVVVDIRTHSPTYGQHVSKILSSENWNQILVPIGFAHGFMTLEADTEIIYKVSNYYSPENEAGILWNDPDLGIDWPSFNTETSILPRDHELPKLKDILSPF